MLSGRMRHKVVAWPRGEDMFRSVLVGIDERARSRDAIALAKHLVAKDGELTLVHVDHGGEPGAPRRASPADEATARGLLEATLTEAGIEAGLLLAGSPSVGRGLHELAERRHSDLLVVGSCSRSLFGRVMLGDHTRDALNGAPCAVAVAPAGYAEHPAVLSQIGVGFNGSPESKGALAVAHGLAIEVGAKVSTFEARSRFDGHGAGEAAELRQYGTSVDLLIVGSRGYGPIGRLVHGSTSQRLARGARCPLLVLTRSADSPGDVDEADKNREIASATTA
jgi:nucleotide-binding universal stress UspA family protein